MTACNTDNIKLMMRDAYNNLLDNDNSSMAGGYANGHYIMSHYNPWLDECERLNELLLIHPDQGVGAELAVFYAYTAYTCAANGCLQNGYVLYMLGADVVQKYGSSKEQNALREVGRFCPAHFDTTPASYDMYFFEVMKKRAEHFAGYLNDMVDEKCMVKAEYAKGLAQVLPELNRRARIFEAYMTTKDMAKNWQNFAPYVADIYLYMAKVAYAVIGYGELCTDCLEKAAKYAKVANDEERVKIVENGKALLQAKAMMKGDLSADTARSASEYVAFEDYVRYSSDRYEGFMAVVRERINKAAMKRNLFDEPVYVAELNDYGKKYAAEMLFNHDFRVKYNLEGGQALAAIVALAIDIGSAHGAFWISNPAALKDGSAAKALAKEGVRGYTEHYFEIYEADAAGFKGLAIEIYLDHIQAAMERVDKLPDKNFYLQGMLLECFKLGVSIANAVYLKNRFRNA